MKLTTIEADNWKMDGGVAFGVVPKSLWIKVYPEDVNNLIRITTRCLLIQSGERNILIDVGMGDKREDKYYSYKYRFGECGLEKPLKKAGLSPAEVTDILFTHLHDDHVGGATRYNDSGEIEEIFPNARYWCSEAQWEWSKNSNKREAAAFFKDNLEPLEKSGRLNLIKNEGKWLPDIEIRIFNGHTRGQIIPLIRACDTTIVYAADFIPAMAYIPIPWVPSVDIEPLLTLREKELFLTETLENNYVLLFEHDYLHEACRLANTEKGIIAGEELKINQLCNQKL
jgi:glyoxylase-like metal-dependent hydrolase (beta-lactamase superfamily II)